MRTLLFLLPVVLAGCSTTPSASQREILKRSQAEVARREPWAATAAVFVKNPDDYWGSTWKVRAGALDYSAYYPVYKGVYLVPGTERELRFTRDGCLIEYKSLRDLCATGETIDSTETFIVPAK